MAFSIPTTHNLTWEAWIRPDVLQFPNDSNGYVDWMGKCQDYSPTCEWEARMYTTTNGENRCNRISAYIFNSSAESVTVSVQVEGWYGRQFAGRTYQPVTQRRLLDTQAGTGVTKPAPLPAFGRLQLAAPPAPTSGGSAAAVVRVTTFHATANGGLSSEILVMPIAIRERIIAVIFGDGAKVPLPDAALHATIREAGLAYERMILAAKKGKPA